MDMLVLFDGFALNTDTRLCLAGVLVSSAANATSFSDFLQVKPFFQKQGEGAFCIPLDFSANANGTSLKDGQNVTIQVTLLLLCSSYLSTFIIKVLFDGGDGTLFQVSLTLIYDLLSRT